MAAPRSAAASSVVVVLQPVSCALTRFSTLTRFHNDNSLVDLTAAHNDDDADAIATVFNGRIRHPSSTINSPHA
jgi:hypothetical protein